MTRNVSITIGGVRLEPAGPASFTIGGQDQHGTEVMETSPGCVTIRRRGEVQPATWEATVLPMLQRAMAKRPELRGAKVQLEVTESHHFEVKLHGEGWDRTANVCRGPMVLDIETDCATLAESAKLEAAAYLAAKKDAGGCTLSGRALAAKLLGPPDRPRKVAAQPPNEAPFDVTKRRAPLPGGWRWDDSVRTLRAVCSDGAAELKDDGHVHWRTDGNSLGRADVAMVTLAMGREAAWLGLTWREQEIRTPLPVGWRWDPAYRVSASGPREFAILGDENIVDTFTGRPVPPAVLDAMRTEAARLGLARLEPEPMVERAPAGYTFTRRSASKVSVNHGLMGPCLVFAEYAEPTAGLWISRPEHRAAFDWAKRMIAEGGAS